MNKVVTVAVVGAGAAGLSALRLLNHSPNYSLTTFKATAFEQTSQIGGTWFYTDCVGVDELGLPVHSSMYKSLRTNLPKECMSFPDYKFPPHLPSFITHQDVQNYLEDYASHFGLWKDIKFRTIVEHIKPVSGTDNQFGVKWEVTTSDVMNRKEKQSQTFDAVLVCNGHYAKPLMPTTVSGLQTFEGDVIHSHDYRDPEAYADKTVVVLGAKSSGQDIACEVARVAKQVYLSHNLARLSTYLPNNIDQKPGIKHCDKQRIEFHDGSVSDVDAIILCTGYMYDFPFLDDSIGISVEDERVTPLFKHFLSVDFPSLAIVGILKSVIPFPIFYNQILYFRSIMEGSGRLLSKEEMQEDEEREFRALASQNRPARYAHVVANGQFDYLKELADLGHFENIPPVIEKIYNAAHTYRHANVTTYRSLNFVMSNNGTDFNVQGPETETGNDSVRE